MLCIGIILIVVLHHPYFIFIAPIVSVLSYKYLWNFSPLVCTVLRKSHPSESILRVWSTALYTDFGMSSKPDLSKIFFPMESLWIQFALFFSC